MVQAGTRLGAYEITAPTVRSTIDCLIAVIAEEGGCHVLARDRDLTTILESGLLKARLLVVPEAM